MTYDSLAVRILLSDAPEHVKRAQLAAASRRASDEINNVLACPECGARGPHDDNGARRRSELSYCCCECGTQFDAEA
jgi:transposase-like protein